jgi:hypothetical protein
MNETGFATGGVERPPMSAMELREAAQSVAFERRRALANINKRIEELQAEKEHLLSIGDTPIEGFSSEQKAVSVSRF